MKIRDLIDALTQMEFDSDQGEDTQVTVTVHCMEHNGAGFNITKKIDDVEISFGPTDSVEIGIVLDSLDLNDLTRMKKMLSTIE